MLLSRLDLPSCRIAMTPSVGLFPVFLALLCTLQGCSQGISAFDGMSPRIGFTLNQQVLDWSAAYKACRDQDTTLAFPKSVQEGEMLKAFLVDASDNTTTYKDIHLGFHSLIVPHTYQTVEGRDLEDYGFWQWDPKSENGTHQRCGALTKDGLKTIDCSTQQESVCIFKESRVSFEKVGDFGLYHFHDLNLNWTDAVEVCKMENADLLMLRSVDEYEAILEFFIEKGFVNGSVDLLYGAHQLFGDQMFLTLADEPIEDSGYDVWAPGEPGDVTSADFPFVGLHLTDPNTPEAESGMFVLPSGMPMWFICKRDLHPSGR